jgi:hypothetical protein
MRRVFAGLAVCSLVFGLAFALADMLGAMLRATDDPMALPTWGALGSRTFLASLFAASVLIIIGRPVYLVLKGYNRWHHAVIGAFAIAFVFDFSLSVWLLAAQSPEAVVLAGVPGLLREAIKNGLLGALAGYAYWRVARPDRAAALTPP